MSMHMRDGAHTIGRWIVDRARTSPQRIAIDDRGVTTDYATLANRSVALAERLRAEGYGAGDRIATVSGNSTDHVVTFFACALSGVAFVPLSWRLTPGELSDVMLRADPAMVVVDDEHLALARAALQRMSAPPVIAATGTTGIESFVPPAAAPRPPRPVRDDDALLVIFTSGSEARPKGVVLTHENCFWNNLSLAAALPMTQNDVVLSVLPQFHVAAWNCQPLLAWWVGARVVLERSFHPSRTLSLIEERGVTAMMGVPTLYAMLTADESWDATDVSTLRSVLVGGATLPTDTQQAWMNREVPLTQGYGLTEASPNVLYLDSDDAARFPGAVGRPYPHVAVQVVDVNSSLPLEGEATGELWVQGPGVFAGYLDDAESTEAAISDGWLRTGDLVSRDEHGVFRVIERLKNIYISGGENVAPAEVEQVLLRHPLVREAAVVGVSDAVWGERGVAFVVPVPGAVLAVDEVLAHARCNLAGYKVPVRVEVIDELPRTTIEKLARTHLKELAHRLLQGEPS